MTQPHDELILLNHLNDTPDISRDSIHHTLGIQPVQASPGDHIHDGKSSKSLSGYFVDLSTNQTIHGIKTFTDQTVFPKLSQFTPSGSFLVGPAAGATIGIELGDTNSGISTTPFIDFHSNSVSSDYDARLLASGGDGASGHGSLAAYVGLFAINGGVSTTPPFIVNAIAGHSVDLADFRVNGNTYAGIDSLGGIWSRGNNSGNGLVRLNGGGTSSAGYIDFTGPNGIRLGYMGNNGNASVTDKGLISINTGRFQVGGQDTAQTPFYVNAASGQATNIAAFAINGSNKVVVNTDGRINANVGMAVLGFDPGTGTGLYVSPGSPSTAVAAIIEGLFKHNATPTGGQYGRFISVSGQGVVIAGTDYVADHLHIANSVTVPRVWGHNPVVQKDQTTAAATNANVIGMEVSATNNTVETAAPLRNGELTAFFASYINASSGTASAAYTSGGARAGWVNGVWLDGIATGGTHISIRNDVGAGNQANVGIDFANYAGSFATAAIAFGNGHPIKGLNNARTELLNMMIIDASDNFVLGDGVDSRPMYLYTSSLRIVNTATATTATAGARALPTNPSNFLTVQVNGTTQKIPLYNN